MYFEKFPYTYYSLDDRKSVQLVTNIFIRNVIDEHIKNNFSLYDEYDIKDGETPEILADKIYNNPNYHWVILHMNDIIDPRFDWPLTTQSLHSYVTGKYGDVRSIHHYEDVNGNIINGVLYLRGSFINATVGSLVVNNTNTGTGVITEVVSSSNVKVMVSSGGFKTGDDVEVNSSVITLTSTAAVTGSAVTVYAYEDRLNESKRRIKILKPQYLESLVREFTNKLENVNA